MKKIKYIEFFILVLTLTSIISCTTQDVDDPLEVSHTGGLLKIADKNLNYVVGDNATYTVNGTAYNANVKTTSVEVYNTYSNNKGEKSNTILLKTIELTETGNRVNFTFSVKYEDLIKNIVFENNPLSTNDTGLNIGDGFNLTYVAKTNEGNVSTSIDKTKLTVSTRFAGTYRVTEAIYYRLNANQTTTTSWAGEEVVIESVDAKTYKFNGLAYWTDDNDFYFTIENGKITVLPTDLDGNGILLNNQPITTCETGATNLSNVPCDATSNKVELDNVNGKDKIFITMGYLTAGSGPREFYQVLEKIVE